MATLQTLGDIYQTTFAPGSTTGNYFWVISEGVTPGESYMLTRNSTDRRYPDPSDPFDFEPEGKLVNNNDLSISVSVAGSTLVASDEGIIVWGPIDSSISNFMPGNGFVFTDPEDPPGQPVYYLHFPATVAKGPDGFATSYRLGGGFHLEWTGGTYVEESYVTVANLEVVGNASSRTLMWDAGAAVTALGTIVYRVRRATFPSYALYGWTGDTNGGSTSADLSGWITGTSYVDNDDLSEGATRWYTIEARVDMGATIDGPYRYIGYAGKPPTSGSPTTVNIGNYSNAVEFVVTAAPDALAVSLAGIRVPLHAP